LQLVSLGRLLVRADLDATGRQGGSPVDCTDHSVDLAGNRLGDYIGYPVKWPCNSCGDAGASTRSWRNQVLQTGAGGGAGGALLLEGVSVEFSGSARLRVSGGGGGSGCYFNGYTQGDAGGAFVCARSDADVADYPNIGGGARGFVLAGNNAPYRSLNPSALPCGSGSGGFAEVTLPTTTQVSFGGGGGAAGRMRINSPSGTYGCIDSGCDLIFTPSRAATCDGSSAVEICSFPNSPSHLRN